MTLHVTRTGHGPRLVLLHGWALNSHVWDGVLPVLADRFTLECVDLPGHGASDWIGGIANLDSFAAAIAPALGERCHLLGWSLGALVALRLAATHAARIEKLVLVAGTPKFVADVGWPDAMQPTALKHFAQRLQQDFRATVQDFLALQVRGDERALEALRALRRQVVAADEPDQRALSVGLDILRDADLRATLPSVRVPALVIAGERDALVPAAASEYLATHLHAARFHPIARAAHAPFLSHADEFCSAVGSFLAGSEPPTCERAS